MALNIDIAPTLLDIAGVGIPADMDGESLIPLISNGRAEGRKAWMLEFWHYYPEPTPTYVGVRTDRYKYVEFRKGRKPWLFDLEEDPREERNLYGTPEGEKLLPRMKALLEKLKKGR
jgi:N-acetylglucosamine-6-sulfatase